MSVAWIRTSSGRLTAPFAAVVLIVALGGCTLGPEPPANRQRPPVNYRTMLG